MDRTITQFFARGALPAVLALIVFFTTREVLFWPLSEAKLWAVAVLILLSVSGNEPCKRFLAAGDRKCEPREIGQFLAKLTSLHVLSGLAAAAGYLLVASVGQSCHQLFRFVGAVLAGGLCYGIIGWSSFFEVDPHRAGRRLFRMQKAELISAAHRREEPDDGSVFFAGHWVPFKDTIDHFLVMGATNTGKTLIQRMLMQSALQNIGKGRDQRAVVFDAKQDILSILAGMNLSCRVVTLDPLDGRGFAWNMAADITTRADAQTLAENLVPINEHANQKFFDQTVRCLYQEVVVTFQKICPGAWTFRDVIFALRSRERLDEVLNQTVEGRERLELVFANEETAQNIITTLNVHTDPYYSVASYWDWAREEGRSLSLTDWLKQEFVLVLGNSD